MKAHATAIAALRELPPPTGPLLVVLPDSTRKMDLPHVLQAIQSWAGDKVTGALVGLGLHRGSTPHELEALRSSCTWRVKDHNPDDCVVVDRLEHIPVEISREVAHAQHILTVGRIELHQYAGFSGGYKGIVIGCGGRSLIEALHERKMVTRDGVRVGSLNGNPFRGLIDRIGKRIPSTSALQWLPEHGWVAGDPVHTLRFAADISRPFADCSESVSRVLVDLPDGKAVNFYQASRGATYLALSPNPPLQPGATIVLEAACPEGVGLGSGEANFARALSSCKPPWSPLLTEPLSFGGGAQRAVMLALLARHYELVVTGCLHPEPLRKLGVEAHSQSASELFGPFDLTVPDPFRQLPQLV